MIDALQWRPTIGDPSFMGWFTVVSYFFVSILALKVCRLNSKLFCISRQQKQFWLIVSLIMLMLCINKQLDLQSLITEIGKYYAKKDGWYGARRTVQVWGIVSILSLISIGFIFFAFKMRAILKRNWLALTGLAFLLNFVIIRATSFHGMDILISQTFMGVKLNWALELLGIFCIAVSAIQIIRKPSAF